MNYFTALLPSPPLTSLGAAQVTDGSIEFAVNKVDGETGEFSGVFVSEQVRAALAASPVHFAASPVSRYKGKEAATRGTTFSREYLRSLVSIVRSQVHILISCRVFPAALRHRHGLQGPQEGAVLLAGMGVVSAVDHANRN
jgi:hypothetical protein